MRTHSPDEKNKPQPFSVDEMLDRLKTPAAKSGSSRVVTREVVDGQVVEVVRKRKRRTHQPKKEREKRISRMRRLALFVALPVAGLFIALVVTTLFRYQSESFRTALSARVSELLGARTEVRRLQVKGLSAATSRVLVEGNAGSILKEAEFSTVKADLTASSFFSSDWLINALMIQSAEIVLRPPVEGGAVRWQRPARADLRMAGLGLSSRPAGIDIGALRVTACSLVWDVGDGVTEAHTLVDNTLVTTEAVGSSMDLDVRGGQLKLRNWPEMDIDEGTVVVTSGEVEVKEMALHRRNYGDERGTATLSGRVSLAAGGRSSLAADIQGMELRHMVPESWQDKIRGAVTAQLRFQSILGESGSVQAEGPFKLDGGVLGNLSSLKRLSTYAGEAQLARLAFDSLSGNYRKTALGVEFTDIEGDAAGVFRVRGRISILSNGLVEGTLDVGLPEVVLARRPVGKPSFFGPAEDGFCWTKVEVSGKNDEVDDDLTKRFEVEAEKNGLRSFPPPPVPSDPSDPSDPGGPGLQPLPEATEPGLGDAEAERRRRQEEAFDQLIGE